MSKFIAAMDHSGGSTGGVLDRYHQDYTEETKMDLVHEMRMRMVNSPDFNSNNIWAAILYKDTVDRGMVNILQEKGIKSFLKIDSGCNENGTLKSFDLDSILTFAVQNGCTGTKMRSIIYSPEYINIVLKQQFTLAQSIFNWGLMPIIEPEVPIDDPDKESLEIALEHLLLRYLNDYEGTCILKLTLPEKPNLYKHLVAHPKVHKLVGLSGGYSTDVACEKLILNKSMSASFSRALSEGLYSDLKDSEFDEVMSWNIKKIVSASST